MIYLVCLGLVWTAAAVVALSGRIEALEKRLAPESHND